MDALTIYGVAALTFMMLMYALESRGRTFILAFAAGCAMSMRGEAARPGW